MEDVPLHNGHIGDGGRCWGEGRGMVVYGRQASSIKSFFFTKSGAKGARHFHFFKRMPIVALTNNLRISMEQKQRPKTRSMDLVSWPFTIKRWGVPVVYKIYQSLIN